MDRLKILIAEDDIITQKIYNKGLSDDLFEKRMVDNGEDAFKMYKSWNPDIVILDIMMPEMTGYEVLKKIHEKNPTEKSTGEKSNQNPAVVIMATAMKTEDDVQDCVKQGINGYLVKPLNPYKLHRQVMDYYREVNPE